MPGALERDLWITPCHTGAVLKSRETWPRTSKGHCHRVDEWPEAAEVVERAPGRRIRSGQVRSNRYLLVGTRSSPRSAPNRPTLAIILSIRSDRSASVPSLP